MTKTLIRGGTVLTMGRSNYAEADVLIEDGSILDVGTGLRARGAENVDAFGSIVMPGFVDGHQHVSESLMRHSATDPDGDRRYHPEDLHAATLVGLWAAIDAGTTAVADWAETARTTEQVDAIAAAHESSGIRSVLVLQGGDSASGAVVEHAAGRADERLSVAMGIDAPGDDPNAWKLAGDLDLPVHLHGSSTPGGVAALGARGLLSERVTLADCPALDESDLVAVDTAGASVVLTPTTQMTAGRGTPPVQGLIDRGIRPGLGVGSAVEAPGDMFAQMRITISIQHATVFDRKLAGKAGLPKLLTTREVIKYATVGGAAALRLGSGVIEPGMPADLIVLATDRPNVFPINDPIGAVVWGMDTSNVGWVFVAGEALKREGELQVDVAAVRAAALEAHRRISAEVDSGVTA